MTEGLAALPTYDAQGGLLAVVEAPRGSANKLKFDPATGVLFAHKVLPPGCVFPFDFGFIPATLGEDGDPLDVLVLMDEPVPPGVAVPCRLVGVIEATQCEADDSGGARSLRNDRLLAVADKTHRFATVRTLEDLGAPLLDEVEAFFVFYNDRFGKRFTLLRRADAAEARRLVSDGQAAFSNRR